MTTIRPNEALHKVTIISLTVGKFGISNHKLISNSGFCERATYHIFAKAVLTIIITEWEHLS